jgi:dephospho-CoA kinase
MRVIGLTGGIGSGKSTVARILSGFGAVIIDADKIGHEALAPGSPVQDKVVAAFGKEIMLPSGSINRRELGKIVFSSTENLKKLNGIVHPWMFQTMKERIEKYREQGVKIVVVDAAILIEAGWTPLVDEVWMTYASQETVLRRCQEREGGLSEQEALSRIRAQMPDEERMLYANIIIETDCPLEEETENLRALWDEALKRAA